MTFALNIQESDYLINGSNSLHIVITAEEAAAATRQITYNVTVYSTNGEYSQNWPAVLLPSGSKTMSIPFVVPMEWANDADVVDMNGNNGSINVTMSATYEIMAGNNIYTAYYKGYHASVPAQVAETVLPTVGTITYESVDGKVPAEWDCLVQGMSTVRVSVPQAAGAYGSDIYYYYFNGGTAQMQNYADISLSAAGDISVNVMVEDSRGRFASADLYLAVQPYSVPSLTQVRAQRCDAAGDLAEEGDCFVVNGTLNSADVGGRNPTTVTVAWKKVTEERYPEGLAIDPASGVVIGAALDSSASYDVRYTIQDAFYNITLYDYLSSTLYLMHFLKGGAGIAVGKAAEQEQLFDVGLDTTMRRDLKVGGNAEITGELTLGSVAVKDALQSLQTPLESAFIVNTDAFPVSDVSENRIVRCGRFILYSFKGVLAGGDEPPLAGQEYVVGSIPAGYYAPSFLPQLNGMLGGTNPCVVTVSGIGQVKITLSQNYMQTIWITGVGIDVET